MSFEHTLTRLCKLQASLLVEHLEVSCGLIYLLEKVLTGSGENLIPVAVEPEDYSFQNHSSNGAMSKVVPDVVPEVVSEVMPEVMSEAISEEQATGTIDLNHTEVAQEVKLNELDELNELNRGGVHAAHQTAPLKALPRVSDLDNNVDTLSDLTELDRVERPNNQVREPAMESRRSTDANDADTVSTSGSEDVVNRPANHQVTDLSRLSQLPPTLALARQSPQTQHQSTFPLRWDGQLVGMLMLYRDVPTWTIAERQQVQKIAQTIELAIELHCQNLGLRQSLEAGYLQELQRQSLMSDLFHQVHSPVAALQVFSKLLSRRLQGNTEALEVVDNIMRESDRLQALLDDLRAVSKQPNWDLSRLEEGAATDTEIEVIDPVSLEVEPGGKLVSHSLSHPLSPPFGHPLGAGVSKERSPGGEAMTPALLPVRPDVLTCISVEALLRPLMQTAALLADDRKIAFTSTVSCPAIMVQTDLKLMTEALKNLIDNALKYTPAGGTVTVGARQAKPSSPTTPIEIYIRDTGLGIPPEDLDRLFQRGYRGEKSQSDIPGTGLGLPIVKQIIDRLGADIEIDSEGRGQGVLVRVFLTPYLIENDPDRLSSA